MKNLMKRSAAVVLALVMCIGMLNLTAFASDLKYGDVIGTCSVCGDPTYYVGVQDWQGYGFQCYKCGNYGYVSTPGSYQPPETHTGNVCPSCRKESYVLVAGDDVYCDQNYCLSCNYNPKPTHNFGPDGDSAECTNGCGYQNPNYVPLPANVYKAECGGTFRVDEVDGTAVLTVLTKGTSCVDVNVHDHQCDFCHAEMVVTKWVVDAVATCEHGGKEHEECVHAGCDISGQYGVKTTERLDPVFPDAWTMASNLQHYHNCVNCNGTAEDHVVYEAHDMTVWGEWQQIDKDACPADKLPAGFSADTHTLWARSSHCQKCEYAEYQYEAREKEPEEHTLTIYYRYFDENGEVMGDAGQVAKPFVGSFKEGEVYSVASPAAPAGYARETGMDTVTGTMAGDDEVRTVKYEIVTYTWTINYVDENGNPMEGMETYTKTFTVNDIETLEAVTSPTKEGYTADQLVVAAPTALGNFEVTVTYTATPAPSESPAPSQTPTPIPTPAPSQPVEIEEPETPLGPLPEEPEEPVEVEEPETPLGPLPELPEDPEVPVEVEEPETPLGPLPELPEQPAEIEVEDPDVPLAAVPQTGDNTAMWVTTAVASGAGLIWLAVDGKKRREDAE